MSTALKRKAAIGDILGKLMELRKDKYWLLDQVRRLNPKVHLLPSMTEPEMLKACPDKLLLELRKNFENMGSSKDKISTFAETYHWFFTDLVASSDPGVTVDDQALKIVELNKLIEGTATFRNRDVTATVILPTGDGNAVGFKDSQEKPLQLAIELHKALAEYNEGKPPKKKIEVRIGLASGNVYHIKDLNGQPNVWGPGIILHSPLAYGFSFGNVINISDTPNGDSFAPQIAAEGQSVFVVWEDEDNDSGNDEVLLTRSLDASVSFDNPTNLSNSARDSTDPQIAIRSGASEELFIVWAEEIDDINTDIWMVAGSDNGTAISDPVSISDSPSRSRSPEIEVSDGAIYVAWEEDKAGVPDIFFASSSNGLNFDGPINLSNSSGLSQSVQISASGSNNVFVVWKELNGTTLLNDVLFSASTDGGQSFSYPPINLSGALLGDSSSPRISVSGSNVYVVWGDTVNLDTFVAVSTDGGQSFSDPPINLSNSGLVFNANPDIDLSGDRAYVAWQDEDPGNVDVFVTWIEGSNPSVGTPKNISNSSSSLSFNPRIAASKDTDHIYVVWQESNPDDVFVATSSDGGASFDDPVNISNTNAVGFSAFSQIALSETRLHIVWEDDSEGNGSDVFSRTLTESGPASISLDSTSDSSPRWGLDTISISGTVNGNATDTIAIDWGDGSISSGIELSGSSWGPFNHTYDSSGAGNRTVVVKLLDPDDSVKASATTDIEVLRHATNVTLDSIFSVIQGTEIIISGRAADSDANEPAAGINVTFSGSGVTDDLLVATTAEDGTFSVSTESPDLVSDHLLTVQAHFAGNAALDPSSSGIVGYDTLENDTSEFSVPAGAPSGPVDLTGFNASITFDYVPSAGSIFVSRCDPPSSSRYIEIPGLCLKISSALEMTEGSTAHISLSYEGLGPPSGFEEGQIALFHEGVTGVVDITEFVDTTVDSVSGRFTDFGKFVGAVALHEEAPGGAVRLPIYVGDNNDLLFEFSKDRSVEFTTEELAIEETHLIRIEDPYANTDRDSVESVTVLANSTSDPAGIEIEFAETSPNSGFFEGSVRLTAGDSSASEGRLRAAPGDEIMALYEAPGMPPFRTIISGVIEAGIAQVTSFGVPSLFNSAVDAFELELIDARLGAEANVTVIMSYQNFSGLTDPLSLGIALMDGPACLDVVSTSTLAGIDTGSKTVNGYSTTVGQFALVQDDHTPAAQECSALGYPPGGGGGGLPRPGTGIILFDSANAIQENTQSARRETSGGGGGSSRFTAVTTVSSGTNVETVIPTQSGVVVVEFETVRSGNGQLKLAPKELSSLRGLFDEIRFLSQDDDEHGILQLVGETYATAGNIFDIDASLVIFDGSVHVTIPYDEDAVKAFGSETNVRFLHYNEDSQSWEDKTSSVNEQANTVTGTLDSLSPVTAGIMISKVKDDSPTRVHLADPILTMTGTNQLTLSTDLAVEQQITQEYVFLVQVVDDRNVAQYIEWQKGTLSGSQALPVSVSWTAMEKGRYTVTVVVISDMENPVMLSEATYKDLTI